MAEGEGMGLGTIVSAILILIVVGGVIWAINIGVFGTTKDVFNEFLDISDEVFIEDEDLELREANRLKDILVESFQVDGNDCLIPLDVSSFSIEFKLTAPGKNRMEVSRTSRSIASENLDLNVYFNSNSNFDFKIVNLGEVEFNGRTESVKLDNLFAYKDLSGNVYFYSGNSLVDVKQDKLTCDAKSSYDEIIEDRINGLEDSEYFVSLMKTYFEGGLKNKALDVYYVVWRGAAQNTLSVSVEQWNEVGIIYDEILDELEDGSWYLCQDGNDVFTCFDLTVYESQGVVDNAIRTNCNLGLGSVNSVPKFVTATDCYEERLENLGVLPRI